MAKLKNYRTDSNAINDGRWIRVGANYEDLEIFTRGFTDEFHDAQTALLRTAAIPYGGDETQIPNGERRTINASLLETHLVSDIRHLDDDDGQPVTVKDFHSMLYMPNYTMLARACWVAAGKVSNLTEEQLKAALGNFESSSTSI